jgi:outer membrane protein OmpA-like peptidoglycan-associated protein
MRYALLFLLLLVFGCSLFEPSRPHYVVYFEERSAELDAPAHSIIIQVARLANADPTASIEVSGYTDSFGRAQADVLLSQQRAEIVADALMASGVAANRLVRKGRGQTDADPGIASRRVEITIGR